MEDVLIIGSGPAGWTAAIYTARAGLNPVVLASSVDIGGELMKTTTVENFPGFPDGIQGPDLMSLMQKQAERFGARVVYDDAESVDLTGPVKSVHTALGDDYQAASVVISTGSAYRRLGLPDEERLSGHGVSWCATCDGFFFTGKTVAVVGGGDSALEEATFLTRFADKVYVVHRRHELRASKIMQQRAFDDPKIEFVWDANVTRLLGDEQVEAVELTDVRTGAVHTMAVDGVFVAIGNDPHTELLGGQIDLDAAGYIRVRGRSSQTNVPGVFAAGDVIDPTYRQAVTAAGSGCVAAIDCQNYLAQTADAAVAEPAAQI